MADSIEIRLDQLTQAIKGLYAKSSTTQGEIYNALTNLFARYENMTNISNEKMASVLVEEFRKSLDFKYSQTSGYLKSLEDNLKGFIAVAQNPKTTAEITKLLNDTANIYMKMNSQDVAFQKIIDTLEKIKNDSEGSEEILRLSDNFRTFADGFDGITDSLNKNFAEFLNRLSANSGKEHIEVMTSKVEEMTQNVTSVIASIRSIDDKYKDLAELISVLSSNKEVISNIQNDLINTSLKLDDIKEIILSRGGELADVKGSLYEVLSKTDDIKTSSENARNEAAKTLFALDDIRAEAQSAKSALEAVKSEFLEVKNSSLEISNKTGEIENSLNELSAGAGEIKNTTLELSDKTNDVKAAAGELLNKTDAAISLLQEIKQSTDVSYAEQFTGIENTVKELQGSINGLYAKLDETPAGQNEGQLVQSWVQYVKDDIQKITESIDGTKNYLSKLSEIVQSSDKFNNLTNTFKNDIKLLEGNTQTQMRSLVEKLSENLKTNIQDANSLIKLDLQKLQDNIATVKNDTNTLIKDELGLLKTGIGEITLRQGENLTKLTEKLNSFENNLEQLAQTRTTDDIKELKSDIMQEISIISKSSKESIIQFGAKVDRANLQQIHNAKELLEEIQSMANNLSLKIDSFDDNKKLAEFINIISKMSEKLEAAANPLENFGSLLREYKEELENKYKESVQKISVLISKEGDAKPANIDNLAEKVQEFISNFEYLKGNIAQEIKEGLDKDILKIQTQLQKLYSSDENPSYDYSLEDIETDLANIRLAIEKNVASSTSVESLFSKLSELRTVGLENVKLNRDVEAELGHISNWFRDINEKIVDVTRKMDDIQNNGFEEIKSRILQSEKSKTSTSEHASRVEKALNIILNNNKKQNEKAQELNDKLELFIQSQAEAFNPSQFIDIFYDNMTQTKMLANRVEIIEDKMSAIQAAIEKLVSYVEQP